MGPREYHHRDQRRPGRLGGFSLKFYRWRISRDLGGYGVWPIGIHTLGDQLGLVLGSKSKIEERYYLAVPIQQVVALGDF